MHYCRLNDRLNRANAMTAVTMTSRGQITLKMEIRDHLDVKPGQPLEVDLLPGGRVILKASAKPQSSLDFFGAMKNKSQKIVTIEEMHEAIIKGWSKQI
jgi:antitoxin PrlF